MDIFSTLEENNLLEIQRMQESEQELEQKKQQKAKTMADYDKKITILLANEASNNARISRTQLEKDALLGITGDGEGHAINDDLRGRIEDNTCEVYKTAKELNISSTDPEYLKLISQDTLPMLNEIECLLNNYLETFSEYQGEDPKLFE